MSKLNRSEFKGLLIEWKNNFLKEGLIKVEEKYLDNIFEKCIALNILLTSSFSRVKKNKELEKWAKYIVRNEQYNLYRNYASIRFPNDSNLEVRVFIPGISGITEDSGEYDPVNKTLSLSFSLTTKNIGVEKINQIILSKSLPIYATLNHEYMHHLQNVKSTNKNTYYGLDKKISTKNDKDYKKVNVGIHSLRSIEFYPKLYSHVAYYENNIVMLNNTIFNNFLASNEFFRSLKRYDKKKYKKAVGIFYDELQKSKKTILVKSKKLRFIHVKLFKEIIDFDTPLYDKIKEYTDFNKEKTFVFLKHLFDNNYLDIKSYFNERCKESSLDVLKSTLSIEELIKVTSHIIFYESNNIQDYTHKSNINF